MVQILTELKKSAQGYCNIIILLPQEPIYCKSMFAPLFFTPEVIFVIASDDPLRIEAKMSRAMEVFPEGSVERRLVLVYTHHYFPHVERIEYTVFESEFQIDRSYCY